MPTFSAPALARRGDEAPAYLPLITGLLKVLLAWLLTRRFGLAGLAASTLLAQAMLNDSFMVYHSVVRLNVNFVTTRAQSFGPLCQTLHHRSLRGYSTCQSLSPELKPGIRVLLVSSWPRCC